jgi:hypothetical protein
MSVCVIDLLEVIDVDQHQGDGRAISHITPHFKVDLLIKKGMVEKARQAVTQGQPDIFQYAFRRPA